MAPSLKEKVPFGQFMVFAFMGMIGTVAHYAVLVALVHLQGLDPVLASTAGALSGALVNYLLNYRYTFNSTRQHREALPRFLAIASVGFVLNAAIMGWAVRGLDLHYLLGQVVATLMVLVWNYLGNRHWTFAKGSTYVLK